MVVASSVQQYQEDEQDEEVCPFIMGIIAHG
jgi:hypothetical protein